MQWNEACKKKILPSFLVEAATRGRQRVTFLLVTSRVLPGFCHFFVFLSQSN